MISLTTKKDMELIAKYPEKLRSSIKEIVWLLAEVYGEFRDPQKDLGGYVIVIEGKEDYTEINTRIHLDMEKEAIPEYVDRIRCGDGMVFTISLILLSTDYSIVLVAPMDLTPINFKEYQ